MTTAVNAAFDANVDRAGMLRLFERGLSNKVDAVLDEHAERLDESLRRSGAYRAEVRRAERELRNVSRVSFFQLMKDQASFQAQVLDSSIGRIWRPKTPSISEAFMLSLPLADNDTLEEGWARFSKNERRRLEQTIRRGIAQGKTQQEIATMVRRGNIHKISRNHSLALVTTATTSVVAQADHAVYAANGRALKGWQYVAVLDTNTTEVCRGRDGRTYKVNQREFLPPAHFRCRSTTTPVFKSWEDIAKLENAAQVRKRNLAKLSPRQKAYYDGLTPLRESYDTWLKRQPTMVQLKHLGDYRKVQLLNEGKITVNKFTNDNAIGLQRLRELTADTPGADSRRFAMAKDRLDAMQLGVINADDLPSNFKTLRDYYLLQSSDLDGTLSLTNYRGQLIGTKKSQKKRVLSSYPTEDQLKFNPITGRYEDTRLYQPNPSVLADAMRRVRESDDLKPRDKKFIEDMNNALADRMSVNERAVVMENLRIIIGRQRVNGEPWGNFKAVVQGQIKFDIMNISDNLETALRSDANPFKKLLQDSFIDPVLGPVQLDDLGTNLVRNIRARNKWEDKIAPKIASELRPIFNTSIPITISRRVSNRELQQFYLRFAHRLSFAELPDRDTLAVSLGRDLYNLANLNGSRNQWYNLGIKLLESDRAKKFFEIETYGVQKRRMRSRLSGSYFGPYYDTMAYNVRATDPRIQNYSRLQRSVDVGLRVAQTTDKNPLLIRPGFKTYFVRTRTGLEDTRIPITSTSSFGDFPVEFIDKEFAQALNQAANSKWKIDNDFFDFTQRLIFFKDDRGAAAKFDGLNEYRQYLVSRADTYERFKMMQFLRDRDAAFSNAPFIDHRGRIYDRGLISAQSGETFRPFLNTAKTKPMGVDGYNNLNDQIGAFLGGLDDVFEGKFNGLSVTGRQKIARKWRKDMIQIGNAMRRGKPRDMRFILQHPMVTRIDGEEQGKFFRFALEVSKVDEFLDGDYSDLRKLNAYRTGLALEQDASSSGAQIIALTTKNKALAELSNVVPTDRKRRLYDEIARQTFNDPRFKELNLKLGLNEKDLRKAAKAQNMVTFYGAGERTSGLNVEGKLSKVLERDVDVLVVKATNRDQVLDEISARIARYEKFDADTADELKRLRNDVRDVFNKGMAPGDEIMEQLYFLTPDSREMVEKLSKSYDRVVTPGDFTAIARIMSEYLADEVPILRSFTQFFGRLAQDFLVNAKPSKSNFDWRSVAKTALFGDKRKGYVLPDNVSRILGVKAGEPVSEKVLKRFGFWTPNGTLADIINGVDAPATRRRGATYMKVELAQVKTLTELEVFYANNLPKSWTRVPWVNFDGKTLEQVFTQTFEERLRYRDRNGEWITNILQIDQKTEATFWEQLVNKTGKINDIADITRARTAFAVNGNHSNDAVIVKRFHLWGRAKGIDTSTVHDAFFTNIADMEVGREHLRGIYAELVSRQSVKQTLDEMRARGLPKELYDQYLEEAIELGIIPVAGRSVIGGRVITQDDILKADDILEKLEGDYNTDRAWYGVG